MFKYVFFFFYEHCIVHAHGVVERAVIFAGCRILVTLLYAMKARNAKTGLATLCIGGGMGCSTVVSMEAKN